MAVLDLSLKAIFQQRFRVLGDGDDSWDAVVTDEGSNRDVVQNGNNTGNTFQYRNDYNTTNNVGVVDRNYVSFDMTGIPADGTITAVSLLLYTDNTGQQLMEDSDDNTAFFQMRVVKATTDASVGNGATTANAIDHTVSNEADVTMSVTNEAENEFDFGSSDLYDYVVAQHTAGAAAAFWLLTGLEYRTFVDETEDEPNGTGVMAIDGDTGTYPPLLRVTYTPAPAIPPTFVKLKGGSLKIPGGKLKW